MAGPCLSEREGSQARSNLELTQPEAIAAGAYTQVLSTLNHLHDDAGVRKDII